MGPLCQFHDVLDGQPPTKGSHVHTITSPRGEGDTTFATVQLLLDT
jgi:hypothetical protein